MQIRGDAQALPVVGSHSVPRFEADPQTEYDLPPDCVDLQTLNLSALRQLFAPARDDYTTAVENPADLHAGVIKRLSMLHSRADGEHDGRFTGGEKSLKLGRRLLLAALLNVEPD